MAQLVGGIGFILTFLVTYLNYSTDTKVSIKQSRLEAIHNRIQNREANAYLQITTIQNTNAQIESAGKNATAQRAAAKVSATAQLDYNKTISQANQRQDSSRISREKSELYSNAIKDLTSNSLRTFAALEALRELYQDKQYERSINSVLNEFIINGHPEYDFDYQSPFTQNAYSVKKKLGKKGFSISYMYFDSLNSDDGTWEELILEYSRLYTPEPILSRYLSLKIKSYKLMTAEKVAGAGTKKLGPKEVPQNIYLKVVWSDLAEDSILVFLPRPTRFPALLELAEEIISPIKTVGDYDSQFIDGSKTKVLSGENLIIYDPLATYESVTNNSISSSIFLFNNGENPILQFETEELVKFIDRANFFGILLNPYEESGPLIVLPLYLDPLLGLTIEDFTH